MNSNQATLVQQIWYILSTMKWTVQFVVTMFTNSSVYSPVIGEQYILEMEPTGQST